MRSLGDWRQRQNGTSEEERTGQCRRGIAGCRNRKFRPTVGDLEGRIAMSGTPLFSIPQGYTPGGIVTDLAGDILVNSVNDVTTQIVVAKYSPTGQLLGSMNLGDLGPGRKEG